jgi:hypothetical protein
MSCEIDAGRLEPCKTVGGLKAIYIANWDSGFNPTISAGEEITDMGTDAPVDLYKYELKGVNSFDEAGENSSDNGTVFYTSTGTIQLKKQDAVTRKQLKLLAYGRTRIITEGYDGTFKLYGFENGCDVAVSTASGASMGDFNGYNLTVTAKEVAPAYFVDSTVMSDTGEVTIVEGT